MTAAPWCNWSALQILILAVWVRVPGALLRKQNFMSWTAVTFFTPEYEKYVPDWKASIEALGGIPLAVPMASTGDWAKNTGLKPKAILQAIARVTTEWFIYTDVDTLLTEVPNVPSSRWDVAVTENLVTFHRNRISAAVIMFNRSRGAEVFIQLWKTFCARCPGKDHGMLTQTISRFRKDRKAMVVDHTIKWVPNGLREEEQDAVPSVLKADDPASNHVILFKYPSRERPQLFFRSLDSIVENLTNKNAYHIACTLDEDDKSMNCPEVRDRLAGYANLSVQWGRSTSKIHAVNRDMPDVVWDILVCMSDDMVFTKVGFDDNIRAAMVKAFPFNDGLLHFPDQHAKQSLATMYIAGRGFYERFGYIYDPDFKSLWCDNLVQDLAVNSGKYKYVPQTILEHRHPAWRLAQKDALYVRNDAHWDADKKTYELKEKGQGVCHVTAKKFHPKPVLTICIPTIKGREHKFAKLLKHVRDQSLDKPVEIVTAYDNREISIGKKRQLLLENSSGEYVVMLDDDDWVVDDYVAQVLSALHDKPDCVGFEMDCIGTPGRTASISIKYNSWERNVDGFDYVRCPLVESPMRLEHALKVGYEDKRFGEDHSFSIRLKDSGLLKKENYIKKPIYTYLFTPGDSMTKYGVPTENVSSNEKLQSKPRATGRNQILRQKR